MNKDTIFSERKALKKKGHEVVRSHYVVLVFLSLILSLFGVEYNHTTIFWGNNSTSTQSGKDNPGSILDLDDVVTASDAGQTDEVLTGNRVLDLLLNGRVAESLSVSDEISKELVNKDSSKALGRTRGVLAQIMNAVGSGRLFAMLGKAIRSVTKSDTAVSVVFIIGAFLWYALIFTFLKNVYSAVIRRVFLEARVYNKVYFQDVSYFAAVKRWARASWVMLVQYVYYILWSLTIVGAFVKRYSYWAVPYIVAENPGIGAKEAITLSRRMMDGHKWELFKFQVTMLGWRLLSLVTFGFSDLAYGISYSIASETEFYAIVREMAIEGEMAGSEVFCDPYLFEKADRILLYETYFDVVDEITVLHENRIELTGWRKVIADWFGVWVGSLKKKKAYDEQEGRAYAIERYKMSMAGKAYPQWLNPLLKRKELDRTASHFTYLRNYTIWTLFLLFIMFSFVGWSWEVALHFLQTGNFANRGTLHGPWLPIYGSGGIIVLILCSHFRKKPVVEFFTAILLCGILEYISGWLLETKYHVRWWSYDGYFLNLHGRICAEGLLVFGVGCCMVVYFFAPSIDYLLSRIKPKILIGVSLVIGVIYFSDVFYSGKHPNMAKGAVERKPETAAVETEMISEEFSEEQETNSHTVMKN